MPRPVPDRPAASRRVAEHRLLHHEDHRTRGRWSCCGWQASRGFQAAGWSRRAGRYPQQSLHREAGLRRDAPQHRWCSGQSRPGPPEAGPRGAGALGVRPWPYRRGLAGTAAARRTCVTGRVAGRSNSGFRPCGWSGGGVSAV